MQKLFLSILMLLTISFAQARSKRAFMVGISHYDNSVTDYEWNDIHGVEDVMLLHPLLMKQGFLITELLDENATYIQIKNGISNFVNSCKNGDFVYLHFSMHGQPFEDKNGDESDKWDEALVPYDACKNFKKGKYEGECHLVDDELNTLITSLRKKLGEEGQVYVIIDACHAGTSSRGDEATRGTMIGFSSNPDNQYTPPLEQKNNYVLTQSNGSCPITYVEACRSDQINRELKTEDGIYGALSYNVAQALKQVNISYNRNQFIDAVKQSAKIKGNWPHNQNMVVETSN